MSNFVNKYEPTNLDDLVLDNERVRMKLKLLLEKKLTRSTILYGDPGTGKSTISRILLTAWSLFRIEDPLTPTVLYGRQIREFMRVGAHGIDEVDRLTERQQLELRELIERSTFILTTNYITKVDGPLADRCDQIEIRAANPKTWLPRARFILADNGIDDVSDKTIIDALEATRPSNRDKLLALEEIIVARLNNSAADTSNRKRSRRARD